MADISYLNNIERKLDDQQMKVCCSKGNTIVAAGAGSGKTHVLALRYSYLVMTEEIPVDKILTLTFTEKAAAEMYERIYSTLVKFARDEKTPEKERKLAEKAVAEFSTAHIQTLDSYCSAVVRQAANRYGIRPDFTVDAAGGIDINAVALPFILEHRNEKELLQITSAGKLQDIASSLFAETVSRYTSLADSETFFTNALGAQCREIAAAWNKTVNEYSVQYEHVHETYEQMPDEKKQMPYCLLLKKAIETFTETSLVNISSETIQNGTALPFVQKIINAASLFCFSQTTKGYTNDIRAAVKPLKNETVPALYSIGNYVVQFGIIRRIYELLDEFLVKVNGEKRRTGNLTFRDITELALKILKEQNDIRAQESASYKRIMIDEFQDNNGKNRELLELISGGNIFYVGDEKQSIYKFRGADVSVFNSLKNDIKASGGNVYSMIYNYRSTPELLESFNMIFGGYRNEQKIAQTNQDNEADPAEWIFPEKPAESYEAGFTSETIAKKYDKENKRAAACAVLTEQNVPVHVCMLNDSGVMSGDDSDVYPDAKEQLAYFIACKIRELHKNGISYKKIAVLDRSRADRAQLMRFLSAEDIPYIVDQQKDLFAEAPVNDIYSFMRLCVYPSDMNAFSAFICSPFAGLDEQCAERILAVVSDTSDKNFVFKPFAAEADVCIKQELSTEDYEKYVSAAQTYREYAAYVPCHKISDTITKLWYECGYRYELLWNKSLVLFSEQYDLLFELAREADSEGQSAAWFVDELALKQNTGFFDAGSSDINTDEVSYPLEDRDAVQIMTIHKSKGLEFDYVFVYGCTGKTKNDTNKDEVFFSSEYGVSLNINGGSNNYFYSKQKAESDAKSEAEFRRIIYVGITRARLQVYITGKWTRPKARSSESNIFEKIIECYYPKKAEECDESGNTVYIQGAPFDFTGIKPVTRTEAGSTRAVITDSSKYDFARRYEKIYSDARTVSAETVKSYKIKPSSLEPAFTNSEMQPAASSDDFSVINDIVSRTKFSFADFGTLAHLYLQMAALGISPETTKARNSEITGIESRKDCEAVHACCIKMVNKFIVSREGKAFAEAAAAGRFHKAEYAFTGSLKEYIVKGAIDLIYQNKDDTYTVVDYKTDQVKKPEMYYGQQALYRKAAAAMLKTDVSSVHCILYYLRFDEPEEDITQNIAELSDDYLKSIAEN